MLAGLLIPLILSAASCDDNHQLLWNYDHNVATGYLTPGYDYVIRSPQGVGPCGTGGWGPAYAGRVYVDCGDCITTAMCPYHPICMVRLAMHDVDADYDVDLRDAAAFQRAFVAGSADPLPDYWWEICQTPGSNNPAYPAWQSQASVAVNVSFFTPGGAYMCDTDLASVSYSQVREHDANDNGTVDLADWTEFVSGMTGP